MRVVIVAAERQEQVATLALNCALWIERSLIGRDFQGNRQFPGRATVPTDMDVGPVVRDAGVRTVGMGLAVNDDGITLSWYRDLAVLSSEIFSIAWQAWGQSFTTQASRALATEDLSVACAP